MYSLPSGSDVSVVDDKVAIFCLLPLLLLGLHRSSELRNTYNKRWSSLGLQTTALDIPKVYLVAEIEPTSFPGVHCMHLLRNDFEVLTLVNWSFVIRTVRGAVRALAHSLSRCRSGWRNLKSDNVLTTFSHQTLLGFCPQTARGVHYGHIALWKQ
jgi:hypothetical protein